MKDEKIEMERDAWDYFRSYRKAPIQKKYLEKERIREMIEKNKQQYKSVL